MSEPDVENSGSTRGQGRSHRAPSGGVYRPNLQLDEDYQQRTKMTQKWGGHIKCLGYTIAIVQAFLLISMLIRLFGQVFIISDDDDERRGRPRYYDYDEIAEAEEYEEYEHSWRHPARPPLPYHPDGRPSAMIEFLEGLNEACRVVKEIVAFLIGVLMVKSTKALQNISDQSRFSRQVKVQGWGSKLPRLRKQMLILIAVYFLLQVMNIYHDEDRFNAYLSEQQSSFNERMEEREFEEKMIEKLRKMPRFQQAAALPGFRSRIQQAEDNLKAERSKKVKVWVTIIGPAVAITFLLVHILACYGFLSCFKTYQGHLASVEDHPINCPDEDTGIQMNEHRTASNSYGTSGETVDEPSDELSVPDQMDFSQ